VCFVNWQALAILCRASCLRARLHNYITHLKKSALAALFYIYANMCIKITGSARVCECESVCGGVISFTPEPPREFKRVELEC